MRGLGAVVMEQGKVLAWNAISPLQLGYSGVQVSRITGTVVQLAGDVDRLFNEIRNPEVGFYDLARYNDPGPTGLMAVVTVHDSHTCIPPRGELRKMARKLQAALMVLTLMTGCKEAVKEEAANVTSPAQEESLRLQRYVAAKAAHDDANKNMAYWFDMRKKAEKLEADFKKLGDEKLAEDQRNQISQASEMVSKYSEKSFAAKKLMDENSPVSSN
jgi:hypothetical protein